MEDTFVTVACVFVVFGVPLIGWMQYDEWARARFSSRWWKEKLYSLEDRISRLEREQDIKND